MKQALKNEHIPIVDSNEFHRRIASIAHKIDCDIMSVRAIVQPILEQLIAEMLAPRAPKTERHRKGNNKRNISQQREMPHIKKHVTGEDILARALWLERNGHTGRAAELLEEYIANRR